MMKKLTVKALTILVAFLLSASVVMATTSIKAEVNGMVCAFCAKGIEKKLNALPERAASFVDLKSRIVVLELKDGQDLALDKFTKIIKDAGYSVSKLEKVPQSAGEIKSTLLKETKMMETDTENEEGLSAVKTAQKINVLSLFTSSSTLICCALPATLVAIGSAATLTSLITQFPQLIWLSEHKALVFGLAGTMLLIAGYLQWHARNAPCPANPRLASLCQRTRRQSVWVYGISVVLFLVGCFFAFVAPLLI